MRLQSAEIITLMNLQFLTKIGCMVLIYDFALMFVHLLIKTSFKHNMLVILLFLLFISDMTVFISFGPNDTILNMTWRSIYDGMHVGYLNLVE